MDFISFSLTKPQYVESNDLSQLILGQTKLRASLVAQW